MDATNNIEVVCTLTHPTHQQTTTISDIKIKRYVISSDDYGYRWQGVVSKVSK